MDQLFSVTVFLIGLRAGHSDMRYLCYSTSSWPDFKDVCKMCVIQRVIHILTGDIKKLVWEAYSSESFWEIHYEAEKQQQWPWGEKKSDCQREKPQAAETHK